MDKRGFSLEDRDIDKLRHAFGKMATSYKYFWFLAILKIYNEVRMDSIQYKDILIEMASIAWKYVFAIESQFPSQDQLPVYLRTIQAQYLEQSITPNCQIKTRLLELFAKYPAISLKQMGFPRDWKFKPLWK